MVATVLWVVESGCHSTAVMECGCHGILGSRVWLPWWLGRRLWGPSPAACVWQVPGRVCRAGVRLWTAEAHLGLMSQGWVRTIFPPGVSSHQGHNDSLTTHPCPSAPRTPLVFTVHGEHDGGCADLPLAVHRVQVLQPMWHLGERRECLPPPGDVPQPPSPPGPFTLPVEPEPFPRAPPGEQQ